MSTTHRPQESTAAAKPAPHGKPVTAAPLRSQAEATTVGELMSRTGACLNPDDRLDAVTKLFLERGISSAPVVDDAWKPLGMISKTDLLRAISEEYAGRMNCDAQEHQEAEQGACSPSYFGAADQHSRVREITSPNVLFLHQDAPISVAAALMAYEGVHRLPIVALSGEVVGIISTLDIVKWVARCTDLDNPGGK